MSPKKPFATALIASPELAEGVTESKKVRGEIRRTARPVEWGGRTDAHMSGEATHKTE